MTGRDLYEMALLLWGTESQKDMLLEEMAELQKEILKTRRNPFFAREKIAEEVADVEIMLDQVKHMYGIDVMADEIRQKKLLRLAQRIERCMKKNAIATESGSAAGGPENCAFVFDGSPEQPVADHLQPGVAAG